MIDFETYKLFYEHLYDYPGSTNSLLETIGKQITVIAKDLYLAKMDIEINLPPIFCERFPFTYKDTIYDSKKEVNLIPVQTDFSTSHDGVITITAYSEKDTKWTREQVGEIIFLNEQIMVLISRSRLQSQIKKAEETDSITNVLNLSGIMHVGELLNIKRILSKFSVISLNINNFTAYNERYGHASGDIILKAYATALSDFIGKDGVIGRNCADNFTVIISSSRVESLVDYLNRCILHIELDVETKETIGFSTRMGICDGKKANYFPQLFVYASQALQEAKMQTDKKVVYYQ